MSKRLKYVGIIVAIIVVALLILYLAFEHLILPTIVRAAIKYVTDLDIHMNRIALDPFEHRVTIKGFKIFNPEGFKPRVLASAPLLIIDFKKKTFFEKGAFLDAIVIHLEEFNIVRNKEDVVNLSKLKALTPQEKPKEKDPFLVDSCIIKIEKVRYTDYTKDEEGLEKVVDLEVEEEYKKMKNPDNIARTIAFKIFFSGELGNIGVNILEIQKNLAKLAEENKKLAEELEKLKQERDEKAKKEIEGKIETIKEEINTIEGNNKNEIN